MYALPPLPYGYDALQPTLSDKTLHHHHDKHHAKYVETLNGLVKDDAALGRQPLEALIGQAREQKGKLFNQAGQAWNHGFFWECMSPQKGQPGETLQGAISQAFGSLDQLKQSFVRDGVGHFGSGWVWLAVRDGQLAIVTTHDGDTLADRDDLTPILVADLWEHAYYLDYQQNREGFLTGWFDNIVNWSFVDAQFQAAVAGERAYRYPQPETVAA